MYCAFGLLLSILLIATQIKAERVTVCSNYDSVDAAKRQCVGQTVFVRGEPGQNGPPGPKGDKGDPGQGNGCNCVATASQEYIRNYVDQEIQRRLSCLVAEPGWSAFPNGYQYHVPGSWQGWNTSRGICLGLGGDLASVGVRNYSTRQAIARNLLEPRSITYTWIGLTNSTGAWTWQDGVPATPDNAHWSPGQPDNLGASPQCGAVWDAPHNYLTDDGPCSNHAAALCEKRIVC